MKSPALPLVFLALLGSFLTHPTIAQVGGICDRTEDVQTAILDQIDGVSDCSLVTDAHLAGITEIGPYIENELSAGDFDGLTSVTALLLKGPLTSLPAGIFDPLTNLTSIDLFAPNLSTLPDGVFDQLTKLSALQIFGTQLTSLPDGIFDQLISLTDLYLPSNQLATLPAGLLSGLSSLDLLDLSGNAVDPLPLMVSLQKVGNDQFKAVAPSGAPFDMVLPLSVINGSINGGETTLTIPKGSLESEILTVSITASLAAVNIGNLPGLPPDHSGYALVKSADLPLIFREPGGSTFTPVCDRTPQVRDKIVASVPGASNCGDVTEAHLATITELGVGRLTILGNTVGKELTTLQGGDLDGLIGLATLVLAGGQSTTSIPAGLFDELISLTNLFLIGNFRSLPEGVFDSLTPITDLSVLSSELSSLPSGTFDKLTALTTLKVAGPQLGSLPMGVFDELTKLEELQLTNTRLTSLPKGIFRKLADLTELRLENNQLRNLPNGTFGGLSKLRELGLGNNQLSSLPSGIFVELSALTELDLESNELAALPGGIFDGLTALASLNLRYNDLTMLPAGIFENLTALEILLLAGNELSSLPNGIFKGVTALASLELIQNAVDPLPLIVSLEKIAVGQFKAVAPAGAPFDIALRIRDSRDRGLRELTIPAGSTESEVLSMTRLPRETDAVSVWVGPLLPSMPAFHSGYELVNSTPWDHRLVIFEDISEQVWSGTITVGSWGNAFGNGNATGFGYSRRDNAGSISNPTFTYRGTSYTINGFGFAKVGNSPAHRYVLTISPGLPACDKKLLSFGGLWLADALNGSAYGSHTYNWHGRWAVWAPIGQQWSYSITLHPTVPDAPVVNAVNEGNQVTLSWTTCDGGKNITRHEYQQKTTSGTFGSWIPIPNSGSGGVNAASYTLTGVNNPQEQIFEVRAVNELGDGSISAPVSPSDRTPQVTAAILSAVRQNDPNVVLFADVTNSHLPAITILRLGYQNITALKPGDFSGLTALTSLNLPGNQLSSLPDSIFAGLTALTQLRLGGNSVDPLPLTVSLKKVGADQFKAVAPTGAPFEIVLPLTIVNGSISGGATTISIPAGSVESAALTVTRTPGTTAAVTVDIGTLPGLPNGHFGYALVKANDLPLEVISEATGQQAATDFNVDGKTDFVDFFLFIDAYGGTDSRFDLDGSGTVDFVDFFQFVDAFDQSGQAKLLVLAQEMLGLPSGTELEQNLPNPFNSETVISWFLLEPGPVRLEVFSLTGQRVAVLQEGPLKAGRYRVHWNARDDTGRPLASGVYLYRLATDQGVRTRKLTLLR